MKCFYCDAEVRWNNDYDTEDEEVSKTIRCILNFVDDEPNLVSI